MFALVLSLLAAEPQLDVGAKSPLTIPALEAMSPVTVEWVDHGVKRQALGVPMEKVLVKMGFEPGQKDDKQPGWRKVLIATGRDGYKAVFTAAELVEQMGGGTKVFLVWKVDGQPLAKELGPFRLVVTSDKQGTRAVYALAKLELSDPTK